MKKAEGSAVANDIRKVLLIVLTVLLYTRKVLLPNALLSILKHFF